LLEISGVQRELVPDHQTYHFAHEFFGAFFAAATFFAGPPGKVSAVQIIRGEQDDQKKCAK
jgi:hypothetical protein